MSPEKIRGQRWSILFLLLIAVVFTAVNIRWLWIYRHDGPLDIDEAGYLGIALVDYLGFVHHGLAGFFRGVESPGIQAPVTTALTGLGFIFAGPHVFVAFILTTLLGVALAIATYFLGVQIGGEGVGLLSALLVASCPAIIMYSRSFIFAFPAAFCVIMALLSLLKSDRFRNVAWASAFGIFCGLLPLSRTMTLSFLPGLVIGACLYLAMEPKARAVRILILIWALILGTGTALIWFWPNGRYVFAYLFSFGYGSHAAEYGSAQSILSWGRWVSLLQNVVQYLQLFHSLLLVFGVVALCGCAFLFVSQTRFMPAVKAILSSRLMPLVVFVPFAIAALGTSQNMGNGFPIPIFPVAILLAVWSMLRLSQNKFYRGAVFAFVMVTAAVGFVPSIDLASHLASSRSIDLPVLGHTTVSDGRAFIQMYELAGGFSSQDSRQPISIRDGHEWAKFNRRITGTLLSLGADQTIVAFGFRHEMFNINTVRLEELLGTGMATNLNMVDPATTGDTVSGDYKWLKYGDAAGACLLLTSDTPIGEFPPVVSSARMAEASHQAGFTPLQIIKMPNGQKLTLWTRQLGVKTCDRPG